MRMKVVEEQQHLEVLQIWGITVNPNTHMLNLELMMVMVVIMEVYFKIIAEVVIL